MHSEKEAASACLDERLSSIPAWFPNLDKVQQDDRVTRTSVKTGRGRWSSSTLPEEPDLAFSRDLLRSFDRGDLVSSPHGVLRWKSYVCVNRTTVLSGTLI